MGKKPDLPKGCFRFRFLKRTVFFFKTAKGISRHHGSAAEAVVSVDVAGLHGYETVVAACLKEEVVAIVLKADTCIGDNVEVCAFHFAGDFRGIRRKHKAR